MRSAGATPAASGPVRLWPELPPATDPPVDYGESDTERVPGVVAPHDDVHGVDALGVVRAEAAAHPDTVPAATLARIRGCETKPAGCPVLRPYYRDLTGDGRDELIVGIRMPGQQVAVLVYTAERGGLTRIMSTADQVLSVELAGRNLILRVSSAGIPGYEYRTAWSWSAEQGTMLPTREQIVPIGPIGTMTPAHPRPALPMPPAIGMPTPRTTP
ncbi:hypothetical protein ABZO31_22815 [Streptomyces sp. HUAS MG47]|uniref:hypothetical protein n=1 Tax=Streptomyces solicamelliae TaxID=3231716 RepID=UPI003877A91F